MRRETAETSLAVTFAQPDNTQQQRCLLVSTVTIQEQPSLMPHTDFLHANF